MSQENRISYQYSGATDSYNVLLDGEIVYSTKDSRDARLFIAQVKFGANTNLEYEPDVNQYAKIAPTVEEVIQMAKTKKGMKGGKKGC